MKWGEGRDHSPPSSLADRINGYKRHEIVRGSVNNSGPAFVASPFPHHIPALPQYLREGFKKLAVFLNCRIREMFNLVFLPKGLIAPLILLAERNSRVWLISNQGVWTRLLPWPSFPFASLPRPLD